jgi:hypothetical protein
MRQTWLVGSVVFAMLVTGCLNVVGAELHAGTVLTPSVVGTENDSSCRSVWKCNRNGCDWQNVCPRRCPDKYSCYSLYGAYGPYGGARYWGRYTQGGWGQF